jgi:superfamily II DNA or RNA helicase
MHRIAKTMEKVDQHSSTWEFLRKRDIGKKSGKKKSKDEKEGPERTKPRKGGGEGSKGGISLKAGGFGLNLTVADYVIIVDPWWNPAAEDQASGRAHRMGQQRPVTVYRLVTQGSVEERILQMHHDKRSLADSMLNDQDGSAVLDASALAELLKD